MPDLSDADIAAEILANYVLSGRDVAQHCGGTYFEIDGLAIKDTGLGVTGENAAFVTRPLVDAAKAIREAVHYFEARRRPYGILIPEDMDPAAEQACTDRGMTLVRVHPGMALHPLPDVLPSPPPWLAIRRVMTAEEHDVQVQTDAAGFEGDVEMCRKLFPASLIERPHSAEFVGFVDGEPVATCVMNATGRTAGIYGVTTIPAYRGRGVGEAMTWRAIAEGVSLGATMASLQASDMGRPLYERMGFRVGLNFHIYAPPR